MRGDDHPVDFPYGVAGGDDNHDWERVVRRIGSQPARLVKRVSGVPSESDRACARHKLAVCADGMLGWRATGDVPASEIHASAGRANRQWAGRIVRDDSHAITPRGLGARHRVPGEISDAVEQGLVRLILGPRADEHIRHCDGRIA